VIFERPLLLLLVPVLALLAGGLAWLARRRRIAGAALWSPALGELARGRRRWTPLVLALCGLAAGIAIAGPRGGQRTVQAESRALDLVIAVDVSRSMLAEDVAPSRLQRAAREASRLVEDLVGDRLGLVAFAGRSYILAPLTVDGGALRMFLDALDPDIASEGGTSLAAVLKQAAELLAAGQDGSDRVLVVFTDGEAHDSLDAAVAAAKKLGESGVRLILVGEGTATPTRIPIRDQSGTLVEYKLDESGQVVRTQRRDDVIRAVADAAGGSVVSSDLPDQAGAVQELVRTLRRRATAESRTADLAPLAWIPALLGALLLLGDTLRRGSGTLVALLLLLLPSVARAQRPSSADRALAAGDAMTAARRYLERAKGPARDTALYNAGTAALAAGDLEAARTALGEAAKSVDPMLRYRALYNLGTATLMAGRRDTARSQELMDQAAAHLREALLLQPASERAKWNLELAERQKPPPSSGGAQSPPPPKPTPAPPSKPNDLSQNQAEQILGSMEREELETQLQRQRRLQSVRRPGKDW
jgi:Ca-activated chloride channel family protein